MSAKQLYVRSNDRWVSVGGGGNVDLAGLATEQYVNNAISSIPAPDFSGLVTTEDLNAALSNIPAAAITSHQQPLPDLQPGMTPLEVIAAWADYQSGIHYFTGTDGTLSALVILNKFSTTGTANIGGTEKPVASEGVTLTVIIGGSGTTAGRIRSTTIDGVQSPIDSDLIASVGSQWVKVVSVQGDKPLTPVGMVDIFDDGYTKKEVDDKLEEIKDFSIVNDNNILAGLTSLQEIVSNLSTDIGTGQIDVLDAIRGVEVEPSTIRFTADAGSPIQWKGNLSLSPAKDSAGWHLVWNNGETAANVATEPMLNAFATTATTDALGLQVQALAAKSYTKAETDAKFAKADDPDQIIKAKSLTLDTNTLTVEDVGGSKRLVAKVGSKTFPIAYTTEVSAPDLSAYAKLNDPNQAIIAKGVMAEVLAFDANTGFRYMDTGEGYGTRLAFVHLDGVTEKVELIPYQSDIAEALSGLTPRIEALENRPAPTAVDLSAYAKTADLAAYANTTSLSVYAKTTDLSVYAKTVDLSAYAKTTALSSYATTATVTAIDNRVKTLEAKPDYYTKPETDTLLASAVTVGPWQASVPNAAVSGASVASRKIGSDMIQLHGDISFTTALGANSWQDIALLSSNARPAKDCVFTAVAMDGGGVPQIVSVWAYSTGRVTIRNYGAISSVRINHIIVSR